MAIGTGGEGQGVRFNNFFCTQAINNYLPYLSTSGFYDVCAVKPALAVGKVYQNLSSDTKPPIGSLAFSDATVAFGWFFFAANVNDKVTTATIANRINVFVFIIS
jgi:hypothetical protein